MSLDAIRWALGVPAGHRREPDRPNSEALRTLAYLASRENDGVTWVSTGRIAIDRGVNRTTVRRHLNQLEQYGLIKAVPHLALKGTAAFDRYAKGAKRNPIIWQLAIGSDAHSASVPATDEATDDAPTEALSASESDAHSASPSEALCASPIEEEVKDQLEGKAEMSSPAYEDMGGGVGAEPTPPKPQQQFADKIWPMQCDQHQSGYNAERCTACGATRIAYERAQEAAKQQELRDAKARAERANMARTAQMRAGIDECPRCDPQGINLVTGEECPRDYDGEHVEPVTHRPDLSGIFNGIGAMP